MSAQANLGKSSRITQPAATRVSVDKISRYASEPVQETDTPPSPGHVVRAHHRVLEAIQRTQNTGSIARREADRLNGEEDKSPGEPEYTETPGHGQCDELHMALSALDNAISFLDYQVRRFGAV